MSITPVSASPRAVVTIKMVNTSTSAPSNVPLYSIKTTRPHRFKMVCLRPRVGNSPVPIMTDQPAPQFILKQKPHGKWPGKEKIPGAQVGRAEG